MSRAARRGLVTVTTLAAATSVIGPSRMAGPWLALVLGLTAAVIVLIRRPGDVTSGLGDINASPWALVAIGLAVASAMPLVEYRLEGAGVFNTPFGVTVFAVSAAFLLLGLRGLLRGRAPGHAFVLMVGESLFPLALAFLVWVTALQMPAVAGFGSLPVTLAIVSIAGGLCFVSVGGLLWRFDDEERSVFALACAAFWLISASTGLQAIRSWLGGTIDQRWAIATAVAGLGVWLAAAVHPAMGEGTPSGSPIPGGLGDRRRFIIAALVLMTGPVLITEYAERGTIRHPMWMAAGTALVLALVTAYLLRLAGRAGRLEQLAQRDELTGVALRSLFIDRLGQALARGRRDGTAVAVLFVDLDRFKQINDSLGHAAGNDVLRFAAHRLEKVVGRAGLVARIGGTSSPPSSATSSRATTRPPSARRSSTPSSTRSRPNATTCS